MTLLASCTIVRGYMADGAYGPMSFSYEKRLKDTIVNRSEVFTFEHASQQAGWIDCYPNSRLAATLFCGGVNAAREIEGNPKLQEAYEQGKGI